MNNLVYVLVNSVLLLQGCVQNQKLENISARTFDTVSSDKSYIETLSEFDMFVDGFKYRQLPFTLTLGSEDWKDFSSIEPLVEISRGKAIKFLTGTNKEDLNKANSGEYQYYLGYRIHFNDKTGLIYYRTSLDYTGYVLSVFDKDRVLKGSLFLSGIKGEFDPEAQKEAVIRDDGVIEVVEIIFYKGIDYSGKIFKANYSKKEYQISINGEINEISNINKYEVSVICDETQKDRVILANY
jgi:hypothetical protein